MDRFAAPSFCYEPPNIAEPRDGLKLLGECLAWGAVLVVGGLGLCVLLMVVS